MSNYYWNDWYTTCGWLLWFGFIFLVVSGTGNWGYTYRVHRTFKDRASGRDAFDVLTGRYAAGEINQQQFETMRLTIVNTLTQQANVSKLKTV